VDQRFIMGDELPITTVIY